MIPPLGGRGDFQTFASIVRRREDHTPSDNLQKVARAATGGPRQVVG